MSQRRDAIQVDSISHLNIKKKNRISKNRNSLFQQNPAVAQPTQMILNEMLYSRFQDFLHKQRMKKLKVVMDNYIGRNTPTKYIQQYKFSQQWQIRKRPIQPNVSNFLQSNNIYIQISGIFLLVGYVVLLWFVSFQRIFQPNDQYFQETFYGLGLCVVVLHLVVKLSLNCKQRAHQITFISICVNYAVDILLILYFIINWLIIDVNLLTDQVYVYIFDFLFVLKGFQRCENIYKSLRMKVITSIYKDYFNLFDLLKTSLVMAHIFALTLYISAIISQKSQDKNWLSIAKIDDETPLLKYVYSFYFACTTMLTVGYGDITPTNIIQVFAVLLVQLFGIVIFAFVINSIGHTLSSMRLQQESLEKDLSSLSKISKQYNLDEELQNSARTFLIDNKTSVNELLPDEEKQLLMKLNDQLRQEISQQNSLKIIKSSIFFLCYWSKKMQLEMAKKLTQKLFAPNSKLLQIPGKQCIYIIKKGKVQIETDVQSSLKRHFRKILRVIDSKQIHNVSHNVYGYTSAICSRPIRLKAIAKDFTVVYYIQKNDFIESLMDHQMDWQYYHELKTTIQLQKYPQSQQAPSILNIRQHYRPNIKYLVQKYKRFAQLNQRIDLVRDKNRQYPRRCKLLIYGSIQELQGDYQLMESVKKNSDDNNKSEFATNDYNRFEFASKTNQLAGFQFISLNSDLRLKLPLLFDSGKQYLNYFKKFNLSNILKKMDKQNICF